MERYGGQYRANLKLALPIALSQLAYVVVQFADNAMVGAFGGDDPVPLAAVSLGGMIYYILFCVGIGISLGITPLVGELFARGDRGGSARYLQGALIFYTLFGVALAGVQLAVVPLLYRLGQPVEVVDMAVPYYRLLAVSSIAFMIFGAFKQFLEGIGNTRAAMAILVFTNAVNVLLNWIFIFGRCGSPAMGVYGAGLATLVARIMNPLLIAAYFVAVPALRSYFSMFRRRFGFVRCSRRLLQIGVPIAGQMFLEGLAFLAISVMMGWFGAVAMGANQIGITYGNCAFIMSVAFGSTATIRVSHCYGLRDFAQMRCAANAALHLGICWGAVSLLLFAGLRRLLPLAFSSNAEVVELASQMLVFFAAYQIFDAVQCVYVGVLRGMQDVKMIMYISFAAYVVLNIPVGYAAAFAFDWGANGLIVGYIVGLGAAAVFYGLRVRRTLRILESNAPSAE